MIKPIGDSSPLVPLNKRVPAAKTDSFITQASTKDKVQLSPEALAALHLDLLVQQVKGLPEAREDSVEAAAAKLQQADYLDLAAESLSEKVAALFVGNEADHG